MARRLSAWFAAFVVSVAATACDQHGDDRDASKARVASPQEASLNIPVGAPPGNVTAPVRPDIGNPFEGQAEATQEGKRLFGRMNCAGCHTYDGSGLMGPDLTDKHWRYGGTPAAIFKSIYEGRPMGMPAWGTALPADELWKIVAYIQSLGGTFPPSATFAYQGDLKASQAPGEGDAPSGDPQDRTEPAQ